MQDNDVWANKDNGNGNGGNGNGGGKTGGGALYGMMELLQQTSSTSSGWQIPELDRVIEALTKAFKVRKEDTLNTLKSKIVPNVDLIDANVSPVLPGLVLHLNIGNTTYMAPFLFFTKNILLEQEEIAMTGPGLQQRVNIPRAPATYIDPRLNRELIARFRRNNGEQLVVIQIAGGLVNLEDYGDEIRRDEKRLIETMVAYIDREWESSVMIQIIREAASRGDRIVAPFFGNSAYGPAQTADARIVPLHLKKVEGPNKVILPSNMEISIVTANPQRDNYGTQNNQDNAPRLVTRSYANVSLMPFSLQAYREGLQRAGVQPQLGGGIDGAGWRPLRPFISLNYAEAGPQLNSNGGAIPWIMGLYSLMCSNNRYAFADVIRQQKCGVRGNLSNLEPRLDKLIQQSGFQRALGQNSIKMDNKSILDVEAINRWIQMHVMQSAVFGVPVLMANGNSGMTKLITDLSKPETKADAVKTIVAAVDALSNGAFSAQIAANATSGKGWNTTMPIYHPSSMIVIDGTARFEGELFNLGELDEMSVATFAGPNGGMNAETFLQSMYFQTDRENQKQRQQRIRAMLLETLNLTDVNINGFGRYVIMDPLFMQAIGTVLASIGTLNTSTLQASLMNNNQIFAPGMGLAVDYAAGTNTNISGNNWDGLGVM